MIGNADMIKGIKVAERVVVQPPIRVSVLDVKGAERRWDDE